MCLTRMICAVGLGLMAVSASAASPDASILEQSKVKTIYVMQHSHLDIGYTDTQAGVARRAVETLDHVLRYCDEYPDYKWTVESLWQLEQWMSRRTPEQIEHLMSLVRSGRISLGACYAGLHSGLMGYEEACRHMYFAEQLRKRYGVSITTAIQNDVTGFSWAYPQALAKSGVKHFVTGINTFIGAGAEIPLKDRPFYWEGPDGSKVLSYICHDPYIGGSGYVNAFIYYGWGKSVGRAEETVPALLKHLEEAHYPYDSILVMYGMDNKDADDDMLLGARDWNAKHATPKMVIATPEEFFAHIESKYGSEYPTFRGDWSGLWEQVKQSLPYGSSLARRTHDLLPIGEALASAADIVGVRAYPSKSAGDAWRNLVTWSEHSGGGTEPRMMTRKQATEDSRVKLNYAKTAQRIAQRMARESLSALSSSVQSDGQGIVVWNPSPRTRTDVVRVRLADAGAGAFGLVDPSTGRAIRFQQVGRSGEIVFRAPDVPGLGYKVFELRPAPSDPVPGDAVRVNGRAIENDLVRVEVDDRGFVSRIYDNRLHRGFVDRKGRFAFGQLVQSDDGRLMKKECSVVESGKPTISAGMTGPVAGSLVVSYPESPLRRTEITLYAGSPAIHVRHTLDKKLMPKAHLRYDIAYPMDIPDGKLLFDTPAGLLDLSADLMPKAYKIVHVNHGGDISGKTCGMTIATKQSFNWEFGTMNSYWGGVLPPESTTLLVRLMSNSEHLEYKEGPGEYLQEAGSPMVRTYETVFLPHSASQTEPGRITESLIEQSTPLMAAEIGPNLAGKLPSGSAQLLGIDAPGVALLTLKKAENGGGYIVRLMETTGHKCDAKLRSAILHLRSAELTDNLEHPLNPLPVRRGCAVVHMGPREIVSVRVRR